MYLPVWFVLCLVAGVPLAGLCAGVAVDAVLVLRDLRAGRDVGDR